MNKILIAAVAAVVSVAATLGGAWMMGVFDRPVSSQPVADTRDFRYVEIPAVVANFQIQGVMRYAQVTVSIQTRDENSEKVQKDNTPLIVNKVLLLLGEFDYPSLSTMEGKEELMSKIGDSIRELFNQSQVPVTFNQVILTGFVVQ